MRMTNHGTIDFLNQAFLHELVNSMTYMSNAFLMVEGEDRRITEWIGIDEMRHMNWLGDLIVARGARPRMDHRELDLSGDGLEGFLKRQIELETGAIELYEKGLDICKDDKEVIGVLKHILDEEKRHRVEFRKLLSRL
jgi:bacterioferritin